MIMEDRLFLIEAIAIGDKLISLSIEENGLVWWETHAIVKESTYINKVFVSTGLYAGVDGICLFFLELYKHTGHDKYFQIAQKSYLFLSNSLDTNYRISGSFYTGSLSFSFLSLEFFRTTKEVQYKVSAVETCLKFSDFLNRSSGEFLHGGAGNIVGLLIIYDETKDDRILRLVDEFVLFMLERTKIYRNGIYWDNNERYIQSLCGFSHGVSGILFAFNLLAKYFNNEVFHFISRLIQNYENYFFDSEKGNWIDLRGPDELIFNDQIANSFLKNDLSLFKKKSFMNAWCHGAAGIGITKLNSNLFSENGLLFEAAIKTNIEDTFSFNGEFASASLCHGIAGNSELFIESFLYSGKTRYFELAIDAGHLLIKQKRQLGFYKSGLTDVDSDPSLFLGDAGVGYFFLRLNDPILTKSILFPTPGFENSGSVDVGSLEGLNISLVQFWKLVFFSNFPIVSEILSKSNIVLDFSRYPFNANLLEFFDSVFYGEIACNKIIRAYGFERDLFGFYTSFADKNFLFLKANFNSSIVDSLVSSIKCGGEFVLSDCVKLSYLPELDFDFQTIFSTPYTVSLVSYFGPQTFAVSEFSYLILENSSTFTSISGLLDIFEHSSSEFVEILTLQIFEFVKLGVLVKSNFVN